MDPLQHAAFLSDGGSSSGSDYELWTRVLVGHNSTSGLEYLQTNGVLRSTFPEVQSMVGFGGGDQGHKDLWDHTLKVVRQAKRIPSVRWAALFHDVGKPVSFSRVAGKITFHHHEYASARLWREASNRTGLFDPELEVRVHALVRGLGLLEGYSSEWTDSAVRRLHKELGAYFDEVLLLARADVTSKHAHKRERVQVLMHELGERAAKISAADAVVPPLPKGLGTAISATFGIPPSKRLGDVLKGLEARYAAGSLEGHRDVEFYVSFLNDNRTDFGV